MKQPPTLQPPGFRPRRVQVHWVMSSGVSRQNWAGYFHAWDLARTGLDAPWRVVALVEHPDGTLHRVLPEDMHFTDKLEDE